MKPLSPATAKLFAPLNIDARDYMRLTINNEKDKFTADFWNAPEHSPGYKYMPSLQTQQLIARFAERKKITTGYSPYAWELAATDYTVELINDLFPKDRLEFHDDETLEIFNHILIRSAYADICAEVSANYKINKIVPEHDYEFSGERPLSAYQQVALYNGMNSPGYGLLMEQGTGKTPVTVAIICNNAKALQERIAAGLEPPRMYRALIVCPNNIRLNWQIEFQLFATVAGQTTVLRGPEVGRVKQIIDAFTPVDGSQYTIVICGQDTLYRSWEALSMIEWDIAVLDEAHGIRNTKTKRFDTAMKLREKAQQRLVLTGTPVANSGLDTFALFEFMGKGYSGFTSFDHFRDFYSIYDITDSGHKAIVGLQNLPYMQERLGRYSFVISLAEALPELPRKLYDVYEVEMTEQQAEYYKEIRDKLALEIESDLCDDSKPRQLIINNVLTKLLRLTQITSGFISWGATFTDDGEEISGKHIEYFHPNPKIEGIRELAKEKGPDNKTVIWACFTPDINALEDLMQQEGLDYVRFTGSTSEAQRTEAIDRFNNDPNCKWFLGNARAGGQGLNLLGYDKLRPDDYTTNADHEIYYSQNWSYIEREQSEARVNRRGTRVPTRITDLVVPGTQDEIIRARVLGKKIHAMDVADLRAILAAVLEQSPV